MTFLVLVAMGILFFLNYRNIFKGLPLFEMSQRYLKSNEVRGIAVKHNQVLYTLNFPQQNQVIEILNTSVKTQQIKPGKHKRPHLEQIVIYQFDGKPDLILTPLGFIDNELVYTMPSWNQGGYMMEVSNGALQKLLSQTYDP